MKKLLALTLAALMVFGMVALSLIHIWQQEQRKRSGCCRSDAGYR